MPVHDTVHEELCAAVWEAISRPDRARHLNIIFLDFRESEVVICDRNWGDKSAAAAEDTEVETNPECSRGGQYLVIVGFLESVITCNI